MRVLVVTNMYPTETSPWSGTFVRQQVESLQGSGVDVDLLFLDRLRDGRGVYRGLARRVLRRAVETRADVVHVMYGGVMAESVARARLRVPVVVSYCGSDLLGDPEAKRVRRISSGLGVLASRRAARRAAGVIVKSENLRRALPPLDPRRVWLIPNGVDLQRFRPRDGEACRRELGWDPQTRHVLFPSRPENRVKRFTLAREAVERLTRAGRPVRLHVLDRVSHDRVSIYLNASDCLLMTSEHEGSPNIVKEALACNRPVVSVDVGDIRERIEGVPGCSIAAGRAEDLAAALEAAFALGRSSANANGSPEIGRDRMRALSLDAVAARIGAVYASVLETFASSRVAASRLAGEGRTA